MNSVCLPVARGWVMSLGATSWSETKLVEREKVEELRLKLKSKLWCD